MSGTKKPDSNTAGLIWITGYSGAGKTTTAVAVSKKLKEAGLSVILLDGDELRSIFGEHFGHSVDDRRKLASVYGRLCKKIADSGITVIIATIAMFEAVRRENRAANENYLEVYLNVPFEIRNERDPKGLYRAASRNRAAEGSTAGLEEPENPDLVIANYGDMTVECAATQIVEKYFNSTIMEKTSHRAVVPGNERKQYWDVYYSQRKAPIAPSPFALFCVENWLPAPSHVLEFGCGNGRDSFYLSRKHRVTGIDESGVAIQANRERAHQERILNLEFLQGAFGDSLEGLPSEVDSVYSRFVMHAMPEEAEDRSLKESWRILRPGGRLLLEFRTNRDPLMESGVRLSENERRTDHYRRFVDLEGFCLKLKRLGFTIEFKVERKGLAVHGDDDPVVARVVALKPQRWSGEEESVSL